MSNENDKRAQDALILLKLISQSEEALEKERWLSQEQMEQELRKMFDSERPPGSK